MFARLRTPTRIKSMKKKEPFDIRKFRDGKNWLYHRRRMIVESGYNFSTDAWIAVGGQDGQLGSLFNMFYNGIMTNPPYLGEYETGARDSMLSRFACTITEDEGASSFQLLKNLIFYRDDQRIACSPEGLGVDAKGQRFVVIASPEKTKPKDRRIDGARFASYFRAQHQLMDTGYAYAVVLEWDRNVLVELNKEWAVELLALYARLRHCVDTSTSPEWGWSNLLPIHLRDYQGERGN